MNTSVLQVLLGCLYVFLVLQTVSLLEVMLRCAHASMALEELMNIMSHYLACVSIFEGF